MLFWNIGLNSLAETHRIVYVAEAEEPVKEVTILIRTDETIEAKINRIATKYQVSAEVMHTVIHCESRYNPNAVGDSGKSRGLVQIHSDYHPTVTDAMAFDPEYAITFLAERLVLGQGYLWSCYNMNYN